MRSSNLVAVTQNRNTGREIILSAHIDSAGTPGAQDNASGVAVLLELARTLPKLNLPFRLRFVFFGAEEVGLLGSKAYVDRHRQDLQRCELVFNMDSVGGKDIWIDMRDGVRNVPSARGVGQAPQADFRGKRRLQGPMDVDRPLNKFRRTCRMSRRGSRLRSWTRPVNLAIRSTKAGMRTRTTGPLRKLVLLRLT